MLAAAIGAVVFVAMWWSAVSGEEIEQLVEDISLAFDEEDKAMKAAYKDPSPENQLDMESAERRREGLQTRLLAKCRQYLDGGAKDKLDSQKEEVEEMETEIWHKLFTGELSYDEITRLRNRGKKLEADIKDDERPVTICWSQLVSFRQMAQ